MTRTNRTDRTTRSARLLALLMLAAALLVAGCSSEVAEQPKAEEAPVAAQFPVTVVDDTGRSVTVESAPERIVSLAPANTEILFALDLGDKVVGVTSYDDYPAEVADIAKVGDFSGPNIEAITAANPDLILATTGVQADVIAKLEGLGATVIAIDPKTLDGLFEDIAEIGDATGANTQADELVTDMQADLAEVEEAVSGSEPVSVFVEIGQNPLFTAGSDTLLDEMITIAGGKNVVPESGWVPYSVEQLIQSDPAVYLAMHSSASDAGAVSARPGYSGISAVKDGRIAILDDNVVSRPGPRIVDGLRTLADALHPGVLDAE